MAATAILRSQDYLPFRNRCFHSEAPSPTLSPSSMRPRRRKRSPLGSPDRNRRRDCPMVDKSPAKNFSIGQVKILKRGEELTPLPAPAKEEEKNEDLVVCSTDRLGPDPETVQKQVRVSDSKVVDGMYAGSAVFLASPPPSSLPIPAFFVKKETKNDTAATSYLRRLLRIDFP